MLTPDEARALAVLTALLALSAVLTWLDARHPRVLELTLGDSLALGLSAAAPTGERAPDPAAGTDPGAVAVAQAGDSARGPRPGPGPDPDPGTGGALGADGRLDLNRATAADLELLPGIGPKSAQRIVEDRARKGPYRRVEDLRRVKGIGPKTLERLRPLLAVRPTAPGAVQDARGPEKRPANGAGSGR